MFGLDKDTLCGWLPSLGEHCESVRNYFFRDLDLNECPLDGLWTFVYKKQEQLDPIEQLYFRYQWKSKHLLSEISSPPIDNCTVLEYNCPHPTPPTSF